MQSQPLHLYPGTFFSRRRFIQTAAVASASCLLPAPMTQAGESSVSAGSAKSRYRIAVCDWMILKRQKLGAFQLAKEIGADGVEVDMGGLGDRETFDNKLTDPAVRQQFLDKARELQ